MACPVCDHTMQNLDVESHRVFWCPRCGTLKIDSGPGSFETVDQTIWVRSIIRRAELLPRASNANQHAPTKILFIVKQKGLTPPTIELTETQL